MNKYVKVREEDSDETIELPLEDDGTLLLSTVTAQFPGATGLKYKVEQVSRGVRLVGGKFYAAEGWGNVVYFCTFPKENKRKCDEVACSAATAKRMGKAVCCDLVVLGLPWNMNDGQLKKYFEAFGGLVMASVKRHPDGSSKGFGFIRFEDYDSQLKVLGKRHFVDGRWCDVKIPNSKEGPSYRVPCKIFVGRISEYITVDDLRNYFCQYGEVTDVYIPKPFRSFGFVTFESPEVAQSLYGEDHIIKGVSVHISEAAPRNDSQSSPLSSGFHKTRRYSGNYVKNSSVLDSNPSTLLSALGVNPSIVAALNQTTSWAMLPNSSSHPGVIRNNPTAINDVRNNLSYLYTANAGNIYQTSASCPVPSYTVPFYGPAASAPPRSADE